jgi:hypothetical protein
VRRRRRPAFRAFVFFLLCALHTMVFSINQRESKLAYSSSMQKPILLFMVACSVAGCGAIPDPASDIVHKNSKTPRLITWIDRLKQQADERGNAFGATEWTKGVTEDKNEINSWVGSEDSFMETVLNEGPESKGIKVMVTGSAITQGLLGNFKTVEIVSFKDMPGNKVPGGFGSMAGMLSNIRGAEWEKRTTSFAPMGNGYIATVPDLPYVTAVDVRFDMPALRAGKGDVDIYVFPADRQGSSTAHFRRPVTIEAAGADSAPEETSTSTSSTTDAK